MEYIAVGNVFGLSFLSYRVIQTKSQEQKDFNDIEPLSGGDILGSLSSCSRKSMCVPNHQAQACNIYHL
jgi:hypothetical protein